MFQSLHLPHRSDSFGAPSLKIILLFFLQLLQIEGAGGQTSNLFCFCVFVFLSFIFYFAPLLGTVSMKPLLSCFHAPLFLAMKKQWALEG